MTPDGSSVESLSVTLAAITSMCWETGRRRRWHQEAALFHGHAMRQADHAIFTEAFARFAGIGIQLRSAWHPSWAQKCGAGIPCRRRKWRRPDFSPGWQALPATVRWRSQYDTPRQIMCWYVDASRLIFGSWAPDFLAGVRVQCDDDIVRRAHVQHAVDLDRRDFIGDFARVFRPLEIASVIAPHLLQLPTRWPA